MKAISVKLDDDVKERYADACRYAMSGVYTDLGKIDKATDELRKLLILAWRQRQVGHCNDHPAPAGIELRRVGNDLEVEVVGQIQRMQKQPCQVLVVKRTSADESLDAHAVRGHRTDGTH